MDLPKSVINLTHLISFLDLFAVGLTFPVLAPHIRSLGVSHLTVGILSSSYSILQVLSGPIIGSWSDVRGRKQVFMITLFLSSIFYFLLGLSTSIYSIFIVRLLLGIFKHTQTLIKAVIADFVKAEDNSKVLGHSTAFSSLGFVIGPIIGGHLSELRSGFMYICFLTGLIFIINIGFVYMLPERKSKKKSINVGEELFKSVQDLKKINWKRHWVSFLLKFLFVLSTTIFFVNQSLYLKERYNLSQKHVGYGISLVSVIGVAAAFMSGYITKTFYKNRSCNERAYHSFLMLSSCFIGFYISPNYYYVIALLIPFGICNSLLRIVTMEILFQKCGPDERGSLNGASDSVMSLARSLAPIAGGVVGDAFNENAVMLLAVVPGAIGTLICYRLKEVKEKIK